MKTIDKIFSVSVVVGSNRCNAKCSFCGGRQHRASACNRDSTTYENEVGLRTALRLAKQMGAWTISLTGSGEPTLSPQQVSRVLKIVQEEGPFPIVQLFTNGIKIGGDSWAFQSTLLEWKALGLSTICLSIHDFDSSSVYGVPTPKPADIIEWIHAAGLYVRATVVLQKGHIDSLCKYKQMLNFLAASGADMVTSWNVVNTDGSPCVATPSRWERLKLWLWLRTNPVVTGQVWGGGVYAFKALNGKTIPIRHTSYVTGHEAGNTFVRQLVVFQDGRVSYSWYQPGFDLMGSHKQISQALCSGKRK